MKTNTTLILAAALALVPLGTARAGESTSAIAFSDPAKPGTLRIRVWHGDVTVHGADVKEVTVKADAESAEPTPRKDGMRVLSTSASYSLSEKGNVASLEYGPDGWGEGSSDFEVTVPRSTSVVVANSAHGDITVDGVTGDIDVRTTHGDVKLDNVSAGALVETVKGEIDVTVKSLAESKPLSFTSMGGEVVLRVPADLKAAVRFRTHRGTILTNFDDKVLVTKTEISKHARKPRASKDEKGDGTAPTAETEATPSADATAAVAPAAATPATPKSYSDDDWRDQLRDSIREAAQDAAMAARDAAEAAREGLSEARLAIDRSDMTTPLPPLPPMTGGKTVSGTLNGGGVEIQATTLNGDITLKKIE
jgi:hypothetical protein